MSFRDYFTSPTSNTVLGDGTYVGPNMLRNKVRPALQQLMADGRDLYDLVQAKMVLAKGDPGGPVMSYTVATLPSPTAGQVAYVSDAVQADGVTRGIVAYSDGTRWLSLVPGSAPVAAASVPVNIALPIISGTTNNGATLSVSNGTWTNSPTTYAYQWQRNGTNISGATASSYALVSADETTNITCTVTATNGTGSGTATSAAVGPIGAALTYTYLSVFIGQSNAVGRAMGAYSSYTPSSNAQIYTGSSFANYTPGTNSAVQLPSTLLPNWGAEAEYLRLSLLNHPAKKQVVVHAGYDGTDLATYWNPANTDPGSGYNAAKALVLAAWNAIIARGETPKLAFVYYHQGEQDSLDVTKAGNYQANLTALCAAIRSQFAGASSITPIYIARTARNPSEWTYVSTVSAAQKTVADANANNHLINTDDVPLDNDDRWHHNRLGQIILGQRVYGLSEGTYTFAEATPSVLNGTFNTDTFGWIANGGTISWVSSHLEATANTGQGPRGWINGLVPGTSYTVSYTVSPNNDGQIHVTSGATEIFGNYIATYPSSFTFTAGLTSQGILFARGSSGTTTLDNVSVA